MICCTANVKMDTWKLKLLEHEKADQCFGNEIIELDLGLE